MEFKIDEQTLNDLELFNQALDGKSIFSCFNTACSDGGKACVRKMLERPLTDVNKIRARVEAIRYLGQLPFFLDIRREELSFIEVYLQQEDVPQRNMYHLTSRAVKGSIFSAGQSSSSFAPSITSTNSPFGLLAS